MRTAIYDRVEPPTPGALPLRLTQTCAHRPATLFLVCLLPVAMGVAVAGAVLISRLMLDADARSVLQQHPGLGIELLTGLAAVVVMLFLPVRKLVTRLTVRRIVDIANGAVSVTETANFRTRSWSVPLSQYAGVAHHVRASLSGTRHEIILVHPEQGKSVLLCVAPRTSQAEVDRVASLIGLRQVAPVELYRFKGLWPRVVTQHLPEAAHA